MVGTPGAGTGALDYASVLGLKGDEIVQEVGWDDDCDSSISEAIEEAIGEQLLDEDTDEICDIVLLWWRDDDGDLVDGLVDATRPLTDGGRIWLLTPGASDPGHVDPGVICESAKLAGLVQTSAERLGAWQGSCLVTGGKKR